MKAVRVWGALVVLASTAVAAHGDPELAASGFVGIGYFPSDNQLGNSWAPEQVPSTAPVVGARVGWLALPALVERGAFRLQLGVEAELSLATSFTGSLDGGRMSYFAPVFGWRAHAIARFAGWPRAVPHLVVGAGGETVASSSPFMAKETDPLVYWGPGVQVPIVGRWLLRVDLRHGIVPAQGGGETSTLELQLGVAATFGLPARPVARHVEPAPPVEVSDAADSDGDGLPDSIDRCPHDKETVNGIADDDGCPEADSDGDGVIGAADKCPNEAEDFDGFQDDDGCPELDNDGDGIPDARDACPNAPETKNGIADDDGCPDQIPPELTKALAAAAGMKFEPARARVTGPAEALLREVLAQLDAHPDLRLTITGQPGKTGGEDLARRRAEAVKWFIVDQGVVQESRLTTQVGDVGKQAIELAIAPR